MNTYPWLEIINYLRQYPVETPADFEILKRKATRLYHCPLLKNSILLQVYHKLVDEKRIQPDLRLEENLKIHRVRSWSGVAVIAVLTHPFPCPGQCLFCPRQDNLPVSYLDNEPAVMRAIRSRYFAKAQFLNRLHSLTATGHPTDKIELIILGGTWSALPKDYQEKFIKECFEAANGQKSSSLKDAQKLNETAHHRIIGINVETRPDFINPEELKQLRKLGITKVEIGVQSLDNQILRLNHRGHDVEATVKATQLLKDTGFKIGYHLMPNLYGSTPEKDRKIFQQLFADERFRPDFLKIYPTAIVKEAPLYQLWLAKKYHPYSTRVMIDLLKEAKRNIPIYCRIERIIRDIPSNRIVAGPAKISNLREIIMQELKEEGHPCQCIRCREIKQSYSSQIKLKLFRLDYQSSQGKEIFLTFEDSRREHLYALLRLRIPSSFYHQTPVLFPVLEKEALIRQLRTYGLQLPLKIRKSTSAQHRGLGKKLMAEAEKIVRQEFPSLHGLAVISGIGVREYYRHLGYRLKGTYMIKNF